MWPGVQTEKPGLISLTKWTIRECDLGSLPRRRHPYGASPGVLSFKSTLGRARMASRNARPNKAARPYRGAGRENMGVSTPGRLSLGGKKHALVPAENVTRVRFSIGRAASPAVLRTSPLAAQRFSIIVRWDRGCQPRRRAPAGNALPAGRSERAGRAPLGLGGRPLPAR